jgi:signal transduction histidine kinase
MRTNKLLLQLREEWIERVLSSLAKGEEMRDAFAGEIDRFYDLLLQAVESGDPGWLKPLLIEWAHSRTQSDEDDKDTLPPVMSAIVAETLAVAKEKLKPKDALQLVDTLTPIFSYCYEEIAYNENLVRISGISSELERVKHDLERLERSKSDFIAVAAHELKTPLTLIEGYASMLREKISQEENSSSLDMLDGIDNGTNRLGEIVSDMIDVSLIDNDLLSLNFQPTWINRLLEILREDVEESLDERNQTLEIRSFDGADELTFADTERLYQVLKNVLTNAIKYTPDGGKIIVDGRKLAGFIEVLFIDSGIGVNPDDHELIFEKFGSLGDTSLHSSGKLKFKGGGPGLGLPIVKGIIEAHGGTIWVESVGYDEDKLPGSTFHVLVPLRDKPPDEKLANIFKPISELPQGD